jgi:pimeloyl-ACP methyl ester carboxylesterase
VTARRPRILFLPGAGGSADFWAPVAARLPAAYEKVHLNWPGAGDEPHDPTIQGFDDLVDRAAAALTPRTDVVAQSLGGIVAIRLALRHPAKVGRLVLAATSGGLDATETAPVDWRAEYRATYPHAAAWVTAAGPDHTQAIAGVTAPTLLLWGDRDPISPPAVGRRLAELLPHATLRVLATDDHGFPRTHPHLVAPLIAGYLADRR